MALETTVTPAFLAGKLGKKSADEQVEAALAAALAYLEDFLEDAHRVVPPAIVDDCVVRVARACFDSVGRGGGGVPQGTQVGTEGGVRGPRDPLAPVRPILVPRYVLEGLA